MIDLGLSQQMAQINGHGEVTGSVVAPDASGNLVSRGFTWLHGERTLLQCDGCQPTSINDDGVIVGLGYQDTGFVFSGGLLSTLPHLPGADFQTDPWAINNSGEIWGTGYVENPFRTVLWRYRDGRLRNLGAVVPGASDVGGYVFSPRRGVVGGGAFYPDGSITGYLVDHRTLRLLGKPAGSIYAWPENANLHLVVVGWAIDGYDQVGNPITSAVRFTDHGARRLRRLGPTRDSRAWSVNDHGLIVGEDAGNGVLWKHGRIIDLNRVTRMARRWHIDFCWDVNNHGAITAEARDQLSGEHIVLLKPIR